MRIPGFTADQSLSGIRVAYKIASTHANPPTDGAVVPQWFCHGSFCCDEWGNCIYKGRALQ